MFVVTQIVSFPNVTSLFFFFLSLLNSLMTDLSAIHAYITVQSVPFFLPPQMSPNPRCHLSLGGSPVGSVRNNGQHLILHGHCIPIHTPQSSSLTLFHGQVSIKGKAKEKGPSNTSRQQPFSYHAFLIDAIVHITNFGTHGSVMDGHLVTGVFL